MLLYEGYVNKTNNIKNISHVLNSKCFIIPRRGFSWPFQFLTPLPNSPFNLELGPAAIRSYWARFACETAGRVPLLLSQGPLQPLPAVCRLCPPSRVSERLLGWQHGQVNRKRKVLITHGKCFPSPRRVPRWKTICGRQKQRSGFIFGAATTVSSCKPLSAESLYSCSSVEILQANAVLLLHPMWLFLSVLF